MDSFQVLNFSWTWLQGEKLCSSVNVLLDPLTREAWIMYHGGQFLSWVLLITEEPQVLMDSESPSPALGRSPVLTGAAGSISMAFPHFICSRPVFFHEKENSFLFFSWWYSKLADFKMLLVAFWFSCISSYRDKAKEDAAAVGNHAAKLLQSIGQVSCRAHLSSTDSTAPCGSDHMTPARQV